MLFTRVKEGMKSSLQKTITEEDAALNFGSGSLKTLLATPTLFALMIEASVNCIDPNLPEDYISIGKSLDITHKNPTIIGMTVTVTAQIDSVEGNTVYLTITAFDEIGIIGSARHERHMVNMDGLMRRVDERCKSVTNQNF